MEDKKEEKKDEIIQVDTPKSRNDNDIIIESRKSISNIQNENVGTLDELKDKRFGENVKNTPK